MIVAGENNIGEMSGAFVKLIGVAALGVAAVGFAMHGSAELRNRSTGPEEPAAPDPPQAEAPLDPTEAPEAAPSPQETSTEDTPPEAVDEVEVDLGEWGSVELPTGTPTSVESSQDAVRNAMESADVPVLRKSTRGPGVSTADQAWDVMGRGVEGFAEVRKDVKNGPAAVACSYYVKAPSSILEPVTTVELTMQINESFMRGQLNRAASLCGSALAQSTVTLDPNELLRFDDLNYGCGRLLLRASECR